MEKYRVTVYGQNSVAIPITIAAENAEEAIRSHPVYLPMGLMTHRLGGPEFQAHWQGDPRRGHYGIEAVHVNLDDEKIAELLSIRWHDDRRRTAFDLVHDGHA